MKLYERFADKEFHSSVITTFGIDFEAYENIVLPRLRGAGCRNNIVLADSRMLTHALGGASALPRHAGRLYNVNGISAAGVFHPKLILQAGRRRGRLIVSSANMTAPGLAGNLELAGMIACDEVDSGEQRLVATAWQYLLHQCESNQQGLSAQLEWMLARAPWLDRATPAAGPVDLADGTAAALLTTGDEVGIGRRFVGLIGEPVTRLIVISPYWDMELAALEYLVQRLVPQEIALMLDRSCTAIPAAALDRLQNVRLYDRSEFHKGRFIHAKMIVAQTASADHILFGSANCTTPALGLHRIAGSNEEACLYRRLAAGSVPEVLGLSALLAPEREIDPGSLPEFALDEKLPLNELALQNPGKFECNVDTLSWRPSAACDPSASEIILLDTQGRQMLCQLTPLPGEAKTQRFRISDSQDRPAFARVRHGDGTVSAPAIITLIDHLRMVVRETSSGEVDKALRRLNDETEASLLLMDVLNVLERMEQGERKLNEPLFIPKTTKHKEEAAPQYRKLSYEEFIAARRPRSAVQLPHSSLAGSEISVVRKFLNGIVGLAGYPDDDDRRDDDVPTNAFNLGDETGDAQAALSAGEEFDTDEMRRKEEESRAEIERRRAAAARQATKSQIVGAADAFRQRIGKRKADGALDNQDIFRLRALLMVICTAGQPAGKDGDSPPTRLRVLPAEGNQDSWPLVLGRPLFDIFGSKQPAIRHFYLSAEHDQIPDDIVECWATCYWCLQACLTAPLSTPERERIVRFLRPLAGLAYRLTLPTSKELLGEDVMNVIYAMNKSYCVRLGLDPAAIEAGHRDTVRVLGLLQAAPRA